MLKIIKKHNTKKTFGKVAISEKEYANWCKKNCDNNPCNFFELFQEKKKYNVLGD